jgi:hypothetical protein
MDINPSALEHVVAGYAPGAGQFALDLAGTIASIMRSESPELSNMMISRAFYKPYRADKAFAGVYYNLKGKMDVYGSMLRAYRKAAKDKGEAGEHARQVLEKINREGTTENKAFKLYKESERLMKEIDRKNETGAGNSKEDIKALDEMIIKWNRR